MKICDQNKLFVKQIQFQAFIMLLHQSLQSVTALLKKRTSNSKNNNKTKQKWKQKTTLVWYDQLVSNESNNAFEICSHIVIVHIFFCKHLFPFNLFLLFQQWTIQYNMIVSHIYFCKKYPTAIDHLYTVLVYVPPLL